VLLVLGLAVTAHAQEYDLTPVIWAA